MNKRFWLCAVVIVLVFASVLPVAAASSASVRKGYVRVDTTLRTAMDNSGKDIIKLSRGLTVQVLSYSREYYRVTYDGETGYVPESVILIQDDVEQFAGKGTVTADDVNMRVKGNISAAIITTLKKGMTVDISERCGNWYKVNTSKYQGYVHVDYINVYELDKAEYYTELKMGMSGKVVVRLQNQLKSLGHYTGSCKGIYGANTREAVKKYQEAVGLPVTGIATIESQMMLFRAEGSVVTRDNS